MKFKIVLFTALGLVFGVSCVSFAQVPFPPVALDALTCAVEKVILKNQVADARLLFIFWMSMSLFSVWVLFKLMGRTELERREKLPYLLAALAITLLPVLFVTFTIVSNKW